MGDIETRVVANYQTAEYGKFVEITNNTLFPPVSVTRYNSPNVAGLAPLSSVEVYPKYAVLVKSIDTTADNYTGNFNMASDAFGRTRMSAPLTLFDSSHRYGDNNLWSTLTSGSASAAFVPTQGLINLNVDGLSGSRVYRETTKVFAYQPGKSLQVLNTFTFNDPKTNLRQRVGYFGNDNGIYLELDGTTLYMVERSIVTGSLSSTRTAQSAWNVDRLDGSGPSGIILDKTKAQIFFMDIEWLGLGTVRTGFVINGQFVPCHYFHHANVIATTYITTASLPLRYEIENTAATGSPSTMKQVCSTVISEGGYELRGSQQTIGTAITAAKALTNAGTFYPVASIRLRADRPDAIVILTAISLMGVGTGVYKWEAVARGTTSDGTWLSAGTDSAVEYKLDGTSLSGGRVLASGYFTSNTRESTTIDILKEALFKFQLERNSFTGDRYEIAIAVTASTNGELVHGSLDWEVL
jgi:hypothetical protein